MSSLRQLEQIDSHRGSAGLERSHAAPPDQGWNQRTSELVMRVLPVSNFHCFSFSLSFFLSIARLLGYPWDTEYFIIGFFMT
jgi:hypothetical protein